MLRTRFKESKNRAQQVLALRHWHLLRGDENINFTYKYLLGKHNILLHDYDYGDHDAHDEEDIFTRYLVWGPKTMIMMIKPWLRRWWWSWCSWWWEWEQLPDILYVVPAQIWATSRVRHPPCLGPANDNMCVCISWNRDLCYLDEPHKSLNQRHYCLSWNTSYLTRTKIVKRNYTFTGTFRIVVNWSAHRIVDQIWIGSVQNWT